LLNYAVNYLSPLSWMIITNLRRFFLKLAGNRALQHILFWTASYVFLVNFFSTGSHTGKIDYIYTAIFHVSLVAAVYVNTAILIPRILQKGRYLIYFLCVAALIFAGALFNQVTFTHLVDMVMPGYYFISYYDMADILKFVFVYVALTSLLKLSKGWFLLTRAERQLLRIRQEQVESELKALKTQINPHFLFNSLNNIYSLSMGQSGEAPAAILKLSDLMRYMLYESNGERVALRSEIEFLENYIDLQRLRSNRQASIAYGKEGSPEGLMIAPLIFLPLVENSFKHGVKGDPSGGYVNISLSIGEKDLELTLENNKGTADHVRDEEPSGIGLANVRRRLELLYPAKYLLDIRDNGVVFRVQLKLTLA
jgi:sensor histidine kinase YesM